MCVLIPVYPSSFPGKKGSFSISLTFTARLAPHPSLVIYAIFPRGAVIADKIQFSVEMCFDNQVKWQLRKVKKRSGQRDLVYAGAGDQAGTEKWEDTIEGGAIIVFMPSGCFVEIYLILFRKSRWETVYSLSPLFPFSFCLLTFLCYSVLCGSLFPTVPQGTSSKRARL